MEDALPPELPGKASASSDGDAPGEVAEVGARAERKRNCGAHRSRITGLDRLEVEITEELPDLVKSAPEAFERCGEEVTDQLDVMRPRYFIKRVVRPIFRLPNL